jgi:hypothetical protein
MLRAFEAGTARRGAAVALIAVLLIAGAVVWSAREPAKSRAAGSPVASALVTPEAFSSIRKGMSPQRVTALLGTPSHTASSVAEGLEWPEPRDTCWDYPAAGEHRTFRVCFVGGEATTLSSFATGGGGSAP